ncbi:L10-interacting MYB domain-containing protein-like [Elaeis guineensis]|uniref:L10-interacting MYB domain-containing protein-like n=1 Tax=Elaeis guineensis var. tenera TaxID=51953 RepID=UPI003C6D0D35
MSKKVTQNGTIEKAKWDARTVELYLNICGEEVMAGNHPGTHFNKVAERDALVGKETGLGWDHEKKTIQASPEWWGRKIKENPSVEEKGLQFREQMEICFKDVVGTGEHAWAPSSGVFPDEAVESRSSMSVGLRDTPLSIEGVMTVVRNLPGNVVGSDLWWKASQLLVKQPMREMFLAQEDPELQLPWLQKMSELHKD